MVADRAAYGCAGNRMMPSDMADYTAGGSPRRAPGLCCKRHG